MEEGTSWGEHTERMVKQYRRPEEIERDLQLYSQQSGFNKQPIVRLLPMSELFPSLFYPSEPNGQIHQVNQPHKERLIFAQGPVQPDPPLQHNQQHSPIQNQIQEQKMDDNNYSQRVSEYQGAQKYNPKVSIILEESQELDSEQETVIQYSQIAYAPEYLPTYQPVRQTEAEIGRFVEVIQRYSNEQLSTQKRYELMHESYRQNGGEKSLREFQAKIVQDLLYLVRIYKSKPKYIKD